MFNKRKSSICVDYVFVFCTHRSSLLSIKWFSETFELTSKNRQRSFKVEKLIKFDHLKKVKIVTRFRSNENFVLNNLFVMTDDVWSMLKKNFSLKLNQQSLCSHFDLQIIVRWFFFAEKLKYDRFNLITNERLVS